MDPDDETIPFHLITLVNKLKGKKTLQISPLQLLSQDQVRFDSFRFHDAADHAGSRVESESSRQRTVRDSPRHGDGAVRRDGEGERVTEPDRRARNSGQGRRRGAKPRLICARAFNSIPQFE